MADEFNNLNNYEPEDVENTDAAQGSENEALSDTQQKGNKKKLIIGIVAAVVVVCAVIAAVAALTGDSGEEKYTDTPVSDPTSELTPGIENGVIIESAPNAADSSEDTQGGSGGSGSSGSSDQQSGSSGSGSSGGSSSGSQSGSSGSSGSSGNSGSGSNSGNSGNSGNTGGSGSHDPVARQIEIYITLPNDGNVADKLFVSVNGEQQTQNGIDVQLNGKNYYCITSESYEGVVTVEARLENYGTSATQISTQTGSQVVVVLPLDGSEENFAPAI